MSSRPWVLWGAVASLVLLSGGCGGAPEVLPAADSADFESVVETTADVAKAQPSTTIDSTGCLALSQPESATRQALLDALNQYRADYGLQPLTYCKRLEVAADGITADLWQRGFFSHIDPDGKNPGDRALAAGFCHKYVGENLAAGQRSVDAVMQAWKNSPGHNANMLEPQYKYVGVSVSADANGRLYWAQEFAYQYP